MRRLSRGGMTRAAAGRMLERKRTPKNTGAPCADDRCQAGGFLMPLTGLAVDEGPHNMAGLLLHAREGSESVEAFISRRVMDSWVEPREPYGGRRSLLRALTCSRTFMGFQTKSRKHCAARWMPISKVTSAKRSSPHPDGNSPHLERNDSHLSDACSRIARAPCAVFRRALFGRSERRTDPQANEQRESRRLSTSEQIK